MKDCIQTKWTDDDGADGCDTENARGRMRGRVDDLRASCRENGLAATIDDVLAHPLERWVDAISKGIPLSQGDVEILLVGVNEFMSFRDSLIVSVVCMVDEVDSLLAMAAHPHDSASVSKMSEHLSRAFEDPESRPDEERCVRAISILERMAAMAESSQSAQPHAVIAYVMWWMGRDGARRRAESAHDADSSCSLASIVMSALDRGVFPAWVGASKRCDVSFPEE
ncbi:hypothetical protein [uncultured Bifidobacterium sp.]|uniref:hypothetical protein n=1 Tax=uncultured Bifidobacterium sp. TaxID=165187 RepID=UPI00262F4C32|nr:hypothetical protein [uncultured Bifidobacterium sp.]